MSKINAIRFINLNYNNNAIKISDETFHLNGESTLLSLRNGGGKSVLVQMIMAPFVHRRYRDAKDRPFESYFTSGKPTFILVEWALDQGAGYVLTGMMVRRSQNMEADQKENLDMINLVSEYTVPCLCDIHHLPVVERDKKKIILKNFSDCRRMFEEMKRDASFHFFCYDMGNSAQSRQYFDKLLEYQINYKEWETIIKKVNQEESGLSTLFSNCRDESGLVEKWFLESVEEKLNKDRNRMKEFRTIMEKYVGQYKDNQSKIKRRDTIRLFKEASVEIEESARLYQGMEQEKEKQENRIAAFIQRLNAGKEHSRESYEQAEKDLDQAEREIEFIRYEKLSHEYYGWQEEQRFHISNRDVIEIEQEELEKEQQETESRLHLLFCAKQQNVLEEEQADYEESRQKLLLFHRKNEDMAPEREYLGYVLREHYENLLAENGMRQKRENEKEQQAGRELAEQKAKKEKMEMALRENASLEGALKTGVKAYEEKEENFNVKYHAGFARNILGYYEPGMLDIKREIYKKELEEGQKDQRKRRRQLEELKEHMKSLGRDLEDKGSKKQQKEWEKQQQEKIRKEYEEELSIRETILKYLDMGREERFDRDKILKVSDRKLREIGQLKRTLEQEEDKQKREYKKLTEGKVLELPEEIEREFENMGIPIVYGMEWLKKNGNTEEENKKAVKSHPFLPYALILSQQEMEKLSGRQGGVYTSFPIPIVKREELERLEGEKNGGVFCFSDISFYVYFNENLLNEEKLKKLAAQMESRMQKQREAIDIRDREYREYFQRRETVRCQKVTREAFEANGKLLQELDSQWKQLEEETGKLREELAKKKETEINLETAIFKGERELLAKERQIEDFYQLYEAYQKYEENLRSLEQCQRELASLTEIKNACLAKIDHLREQLRNVEIEKDRLAQTGSLLEEAKRRYQEYRRMPDQAPDPELSRMDMGAKEARFKAMTAAMSQELKNLEEQEQKALRRFLGAQEELERLRVKYGFLALAWKDAAYSQKEENHLEIRREAGKKKIERKRQLWNEEKTKIAVLDSRMDTCRKQILAQCGKEEPLAKELITDRDFEAVKNQLEYRKKELKQKAHDIFERLQSYEENLTALAEYSDFPLLEPVEWEEELAGLSRSQLRRKMGIMIRDYKKIQEDCRDAKESLVQVLNRVVRRDEFTDDYYKKPLEAMLLLAEEPGQVLGQLSITIRSYEDLMKKLEVDISVVEKEKEKIVELMGEYMRDVQVNLGKIDANSTITVREKPLKMLRIQLPDWEENADLYQLKLQDMVDEITERGIEIFEHNGNAQEYFGTQLNTKNMYDRVIGIGNVQIRLYKIEEQREYPITWADVAKNSGGEGFLSAFVILSSLLYYMRRDDTDLFADRNEGKVLVMDNPFAQTNAAHLLKPLMDVAKKANTQLICLTGLGGESIYNRFDNIYVMNLVSASLRAGMQYLKTDHLKGTEPETMVLSQIEVVEQLDLLF